MTFRDILKEFQNNSWTVRDQGTKFELLILRWFKTANLYKDIISNIWMIDDFPAKKDIGDGDIGIDIVAKTKEGEYWAIQCKCYKESTLITKSDVDTFVTASSMSFRDPITMKTMQFAHRIWVATSNRYTSNAKLVIHDPTLNIQHLGINQLDQSGINWDALLMGEHSEDLYAHKELRDYQKIAVNKAISYFTDHDRGKLIMACGTGKTFTSLKITEQYLDKKGFVLFLVPSISLLSQSLQSWMESRECKMKAICVCSDADSSRLNDNDDMSYSLLDIPLPAYTDKENILKQFKYYNPDEELVVVFSTYQSVDKVHAAQTEYGRAFDLMICDEAHRTTGININTGKKEENSNFVLVHDNDYLPAKKRMYMTATPKIYKSCDKKDATDKDFTVCAMNKTEYYGDTFYNLSFAKAVDDKWLCDYKVLILTIKESYLPKESLQKAENGEYIFNDATKLMGCVNALSKKVRGDGGITFDTDPTPMRRAIAFNTQIRVRRSRAEGAIYSEEVAKMFPQICHDRKKDLKENYENAIANGEDTKNLYSPDDIVNVDCRHIDGSMSSIQREDLLDWLKEDAKDPMECRILSNVRCLSEGVDVPALDAVLYLSGRSSKVDIIQSVGRVMRPYKKGEPDEKKYGYIIIPVILGDDYKPEEVLKEHDRFKNVWDILEALRSFDDRLANEVEVSKLNHQRPKHISVVDAGGNGIQFGMHGGEGVPDQDEINRRLAEQFGQLQSQIFARLVEKVGDRIYWERWATGIADDAKTIIARITALICQSEIKPTFDEFLHSLQVDINDSITEAQAIEMLAQHMITAPIFEALFKDYQFEQNNSVSVSMGKMIALLNEHHAAQETEMLHSFYESVKKTLQDINTLSGKQEVLKDLYDKFFKKAFPDMVKKLGIVYTPIECVDFIIKSVDKLLRKEFGRSLTDEGVHILDPFTGTGTFITRLLQSGLILPKDLERKYRFEIHCNEIVLLAYYVADVNIEAVYHELTKSAEYISYDNICLTDTFQMDERKISGRLDETKMFGENTSNIRRQMETPIQVIIGNPPYEDGKDSANEETGKTSYPNLEKRVRDTYISRNEGKKNLERHSYNSFFLAFRWASDRIIENENGGIIGFISNGAWIENNPGFRQTLINEFSKIYVLNLRGKQTTRGEESKREGGKIFGSGSRSQIAITFLVRLPNKKESDKTEIFYHDIGDYLDTKQKKERLSKFNDVDGIEWQSIVPSKQGDWINHQDDDFKKVNISLEPLDEGLLSSRSFFALKCVGVSTNRDAWVYNASQVKVIKNMASMIEFYNRQKDLFVKEFKKKEPVIKRKMDNGLEYKENILHPKIFVDKDGTQISWSDGLLNRTEVRITKSKKGSTFGYPESIQFDCDNILEANYRPFCRQYLYWQRDVIERPSLIDKLFPIIKNKGRNEVKYNRIICVSGKADGLSVMMADNISDLHYVGDTTLFPLYYYKEKGKGLHLSLFDDEQVAEFSQLDGITDWIIEQVRDKYKDKEKRISKEDVFYYVYGILHSEDYRRKYKNDLAQSLPWIPLVEDMKDFKAFVESGRELADIHLNYETQGNYPGVVVEGEEKGNFHVTKMRYEIMGKEVHRETIIYNGDITIRNIPLEAYNYVINSFPAIHHILDRYCIRTDMKGSGIVNDPNDWAIEHSNPRYILDLLLSVINLSMKTLEIVKNLPKLDL